MPHSTTGYEGFVSEHKFGEIKGTSYFGGGPPNEEWETIQLQ